MKNDVKDGKNVVVGDATVINSGISLGEKEAPIAEETAKEPVVNEIKPDVVVPPESSVIESAPLASTPIEPEIPEAPVIPVIPSASEEPVIPVAPIPIPTVEEPVVAPQDVAFPNVSQGQDLFSTPSPVNNEINPSFMTEQGNNYNNVITPNFDNNSFSDNYSGFSNMSNLNKEPELPGSVKNLQQAMSNCINDISTQSAKIASLEEENERLRNENNKLTKENIDLNATTEKARNDLANGQRKILELLGMNTSNNFSQNNNGGMGMVA